MPFGTTKHENRRGSIRKPLETAILGSVIFELATHAQGTTKHENSSRWPLVLDTGWGHDVDDRGRPATEDRATVVAVMVAVGDSNAIFESVSQEDR